MADRKLHLKIRVVTTRRMQVGELRAKIRRTLRTGIVQEGIHVAWVNWRRPDSRHGVAKSGTYLDEGALEALRDFYGAIHHDDTRTRFEIIDAG